LASLTPRRALWSPRFPYATLFRSLVLAVIVRPVLDRQVLATLMARYSSIALFAFIVVAVSGVARSIIALQEWEALLSPYGLILTDRKSTRLNSSHVKTSYAVHCQT